MYLAPKAQAHWGEFYKDKWPRSILRGRYQYPVKLKDNNKPIKDTLLGRNIWKMNSFHDHADKTHTR